LFDIVTDDELYEYTINTAEKFLKEIEETLWWLTNKAATPSP
jgi:hypothetical protein